MKLKLELLIAWRYLGAQRKSLFVSLISLFSALGVCIGSFALVVALSASNGFVEEVTRQMIGKDAHFEVDTYHSDPMRNPDSLIQLLRDNDPEITMAAPFIIWKVGISSKKVNDGIVLYGIDPERHRGIIDLSSKIQWGEYRLDTLQDSLGRRLPGVMLGSVLANRLRVLLGDKIVLQTFQSADELGGPPKLGQFLVSGIFETGMYEYDANLAYIGIPEAQKLLQLGDAVSGIQARVRGPWKSDISADKAEALLKYPYYATDWKAKNRTMLKWMNFEKVIIFVVLCLIILVAAFNIISSLIMVVLEKTREIGILRSMGLPSGSIMRIFVFMGAAIGLVGSFLGGGVGVLLCLAQQHWGFIKLPPDVYMIPVFPVRIDMVDVALVFLAANALCILATILPAWKASRLDPVGAIRHE